MIKVLSAILLLPFLVAVVVPGLILLNSGAGSRWALPAFLQAAISLLGIIIAGVGLLLVGMTISLFWTEGRGTLAPWDPPRSLVVRGVYRYVRNPMISGVFGLLLGEALFFRSSSILSWFFIFVLINLIYIPALEEPGLVRRFGEDYRRYKQHVPRWIPRLKAWEG